MIWIDVGVGRKTFEETFVGDYIRRVEVKKAICAIIQKNFSSLRRSFV